ncbi:hypothetical protein M3Y97_00818200 [Aphelenchoides bicaudatus]|nr:hypothetical protein M3Y97_00818200 [Aphelenchoides bicaudatus]
MKANNALLLTIVCLVYALQVESNLCPLSEHQVCNDHTKQLRCVCAMSRAEEAPPEQSCTNLFNMENINDFEAVSVEFELDDAAATLDSFPEDRFRDQIASYLKLDTRDILIIRVHCLEEDKKFAVQFVVVKNEDNDEGIVFLVYNDGLFQSVSKTLNHLNCSGVLDHLDQDDGRIPFKQSHFLRASSLVSRMKVIGSMKTVAGLHVASIKQVSTLHPIEPYVDNSVLIIQACVAAVFMFLTCLCGCWLACKKKSNDYEADLQK